MASEKKINFTVIGYNRWKYLHVI